MNTEAQHEWPDGNTRLSDGDHDDESNRNDQLSAYWADERRLTAVHEAGHASMFWFFQQPHFLHGINMAGDDASDAFVRRSTITPPGMISLVVPTNPRRAEALARMESMHALAGLCAEGLFGSSDDIEDDLIWMQGPLDEVDDSLVEIAQSFERSDMHQAARPAFELFGPDEWKIRRHLIEAAELTESALKLAGMDEVIRSLASALNTWSESGGETSGAAVWSTMRTAWGSQHTLPLRTHPWNRRFSILNSERWWVK